MNRDLIRLMHAFFLPGAEACEQAVWHPNTDVYRLADNAWIVKFELAGVRAEDIDLEVLGGRMTLRGVRRDDVTLGAAGPRQGCPVPYQMEIAYSRFERTVELPCDLKRASITTEYRDGMLLVRIIPAGPPDPRTGDGGRTEEAKR